MKRKWMIAAVLGLAVTGVRVHADTEIKYRDVPEKVKVKVESELHDRPVKKVTVVESGGRKWYRVVVEKKGATDDVLRVSPEGELLSADVERDVRATATPAVARAADASDGTPVNYDECPGLVKQAIGSAARNQKILRVTTYSHRGTTIYRAVVGDNDRERLIRVTPDGKVYKEEDVTPEGGKVVTWETLPGVPKEASGREAGGAKVTKVYQFTRGDVTHYRVVLDSGKNFDVTDAGRIVQVDENGGGATAEPAGRKRK